LTAETIIARARALIPAIRDQQDEAEKLGHHTAGLDRAFAEAGFYRMLQPRKFGGYEFGMDTFWKAMLAVSEGDPGTGWAMTLGSHHALLVGAFFTEQGQREIFGPDGDFRCPHRAPPMGTADPMDGGYLIPSRRQPPRRSRSRWPEGIRPGDATARGRAPPGPSRRSTRAARPSRWPAAPRRP
jgi:3-hydroxy-9,10-secoandrosta-1,3,5(10)-triene-9,17-dione monooxygenase